MRNNRARYLERRKNRPLLAKKIKVSKKDNMGYPTLFLSLATFISAYFIMEVNPFIDISIFGIFQLIAVMVALGFLIPIKFYRKKFTTSFYEYIIFNIISFGPSAVSLFILLNITFHGKPYIERYKVIEVDRSSERFIYSLENNKYEDKEHLRTIDKHRFHNINGRSEYFLKFQDGLLGLRIIKNKSVY